MTVLYPDNYSGTIELIAATGGCNIGSIYQNGDKVTYLAVAPSPGTAYTVSSGIMNVVSGLTIVGLVAGKVRGAPKLTGAWTAGQPLAWDGTVFTTVVSAVRITANAAAVAAAAAATGDVILCLPGPLSPA